MNSIDFLVNCWTNREQGLYHCNPSFMVSPGLCILWLREIKYESSWINVLKEVIDYRVTPGGKIEDEGDFSDFYQLPEHIDPAHRQVLQEMQDEELARLLQEQEHKVGNKIKVQYFTLLPTFLHIYHSKLYNLFL